MTAPLDPGEVTYTPTTHRISKAKKGKKVHYCEFPGCNKVFTRAEHRKLVTTPFVCLSAIDHAQAPRGKPQPQARVRM
ncbi:MAG: hypothetical protein Q9225_004870 [Loekoesia sp. 1 TL-2023]